MPISKNLFLFLIIVFFDYLIYANERASFVLPDAFEENSWYTVSYDDETRHLIAKLPGRLEETVKNEQLCFYHSTDHDVHYAVYFNPSLVFKPPKTVEAFMKTFKHIKEAQIIARKPNQVTLVYMLDIKRDDAAPPSICRVFATEKALYFAAVSGADLSLANEFFESILIE